MKSIIRITLIVLGIFLLIPSAQAQNNKLQKADKYYELYAFQEAIKHYEEGLANRPINYEAASRLAECYRQVGNLSKAREWYSKAIENPNVDPVDIFYYAKPKPVFWSTPKPNRHWGITMLMPVNMQNLMQREILCSTSVNKLLFSTFRKGNNNDSDAFNQLYISSRTGSQTGIAQPLRKDFQAIVNESNASFSSNGRMVAYVKNNNNFTNGIIPLIGSGVKLDIYTAEARSEKDWSNGQAFPYNGRKHD